MNSKKSLILMLIMSNIFAFSESSVETNLKVNTLFEPEYKTTGYDFKIADLKLDVVKGLDLTATLKSKRNRAEINDWQSDLKNKNNYVKREKNHDIMAKLGLKYDFEIQENLNFTNSLVYYVDDFWTIKAIDEENRVSALYLSEYIDDDGEKNALGNIILKSQLKGKVKNTDIDTSIEYKANQLHRFNRDEAYLKLNADVKSKIDEKNTVSGNYKFDLDLDKTESPFNAFNTDLTEFPDFMVGNYIIKYDQNLNMNYEHLTNPVESKYENKDKYSADLSFDHYSFIVKGNKKNSDVQAIYNVMNPKLTLARQNVLNVLFGNVYLENSTTSDFEIRHTKYYKQQNKNDIEELQVKYSPSLKTKLGYEFLSGNFKLDNSLSFEYKLPLVLRPQLTDIDSFEHNFILNYTNNFEYEFTKDSKLELKTDNTFTAEYNKSDIRPSGQIDSEFNLKYKNKFNDSLSISSELDNKLKTKSNIKTLNLDTLNEDLKLNLGANYTILNKDNKKLDLENKLEFKHTSGYNYLTRQEGKKVDFSTYDEPKRTDITNTDTNTDKKEETKKDKNKLNSKYGDLTLAHMVNSVKLDTNLVYDVKVKENMNVTPKINVLMQLDTLVLRNEKVYHYKDSDDKTKEKPLVSNEYETKVNVGGNVNIKPAVELKYKPIEKLEITSSLGAEVLFEKKVVNMIKDSSRPDNGLYGEIDKEFKFRKLEPVIEFGLKYVW